MCARHRGFADPSSSWAAAVDAQPAATSRRANASQLASSPLVLCDRVRAFCPFSHCDEVRAFCPLSLRERVRVRACCSLPLQLLTVPIIPVIMFCHPLHSVCFSVKPIFHGPTISFSATIDTIVNLFLDGITDRVFPASLATVCARPCKHVARPGCPGVVGKRAAQRGGLEPFRRCLLAKPRWPDTKFFLVAHGA